MLEPIKDLPTGVIGFEAVGEVHGDDYRDVLLPALRAAAESGKVRLVYVLGERFEGYSGGAAWQDSKLAFEHPRSWERVALVTDVDWVQHVAAVFGWMVPGHFERFALADRQAAISWAAAGDDD